MHISFSKMVSKYRPWTVLVISQLLLFTTAARSSNRPIFLSTPASIYAGAAFAPALMLGQSGLSMSGDLRSHPAAGPSAFIISGLFPLSGTDTSSARSSGWALGAIAGISEFYQDEEANILAPSTYFWELVFGRGTLNSSEFRTIGFRGYLEISLRDERPRRDSVLNSFLNENSRDIEEHNSSFALKVGTRSSPLAEGIVSQKPSKIGWDFDLGLRIPILSQHPIVINLATAAQIQCIIENMLCGAYVDWSGIRNAATSDFVEDLENQLRFGSRISTVFLKRYYASFSLGWSLLASHYRSLYTSVPSVKIEFLIGF